MTAFWIAISLLSAVAATRLQIETSTDSVLNRSDPEWQYYQETQEIFGGDEIVSILIDGKQAFSREALNKIVVLTSEFEKQSMIWRVDSLATVAMVRANSNGEFSLEPALVDGVPKSNLALQELTLAIKADRIAPRTLISEDGRFLAINLVLEKGSERNYGSILETIERLLVKTPAWISGVPIFRVETDLWTRNELSTFVPITVLVIGVAAFLLLRNAALAVVPIIASGMGSLQILGVMALNGTPLTISTVILPSILIALGCAYGMHFFMAIPAAGKGAELDARFVDVSAPVALSGLTTALGFLAIGFVRIEAVQQVAVFGALGVLLVLVITLTWVPAVVVQLQRSRPLVILPHRALIVFSKRLVLFSIDHRKGIVIGWLILMVVTGVGIARLDVQTDVVMWFPKNHQIRIAYDLIRKKLSGISPMNMVIQGVGNDVVSSPEVLAAIDRMTEFLRSSEKIGKVISINDLLIEMDRAIYGEGHEAVPMEEAQIEQYLLLLESNRYTHVLISNDRRSANVLLRVNENGSDVLLEIANDAESWWAVNGVEGFTARMTGVMHEFARSEQAIAYGQLSGLVFVVGAVGIILVFAFRWIPLAGVTLLANVIPVVVGFGLMGLVHIPLDAGTVVVGCIAFGIAVDDTIHSATEYVRQLVNGKGAREALQNAYSRVLAPVVFTTVIVFLGFLVLAFSHFVLIRNLGLVTAGVMVVCLAADLILLPALLFGIRNSQIRIDRSPWI